MSQGIVAEPSGEAIEGTDQAAHSVTKPAVEVTFATRRTGDNVPLDVDSARAARIRTGIARMQAAGAAQGKAAAPAAAPAAKAETAKAAAAAVPAAQASKPAVVLDPLSTEPLDSAPAGEAQADAGEGEAQEDKPAAEQGQPEGDAGEAQAGEEQAQGEGEATPDEGAAKEEKADAKPDPVALAAYKADLDAAHAELALARAKLERAGGVSDEDRTAYIERPVDTLRAVIAARLGVKPDAPEVKDELAHLQRELTIEMVGLDNLPDEQKHKRTTERYERSERLKQTVRTASQSTAAQAQQHQQVVGFVAQALESAREEFPFVGLASELDRQPPAEVALTLWLAAVKAGKVAPGGDDAANVREALRLTNEHYKTRLAKLTARQPTTTAPAPAPAPAASPKGAAPGAPASTKSAAPPKGGSATPRTLSARQAAAAPIAKVTPDTSKPASNAPIEVDPNDRGGREQRMLAIGRRHLTK